MAIFIHYVFSLLLNFFRLLFLCLLYHKGHEALLRFFVGIFLFFLRNFYCFSKKTVSIERPPTPMCACIGPYSLFLLNHSDYSFRGEYSTHIFDFFFIISKAIRLKSGFLVSIKKMVLKDSLH